VGPGFVDELAHRIAREIPSLNELAPEDLGALARIVVGQRLAQDLDRKVDLAGIDFKPERATFLEKAGRTKSPNTQRAYRAALDRLDSFAARRALPVLAMKAKDADDFAYGLAADGRAGIRVAGHRGRVVFLLFPRTPVRSDSQPIPRNEGVASGEGEEGRRLPESGGSNHNPLCSSPGSSRRRRRDALPGPPCRSPAEPYNLGRAVQGTIKGEGYCGEAPGRSARGDKGRRARQPPPIRGDHRDEARGRDPEADGEARQGRRYRRRVLSAVFLGTCSLSQSTGKTGIYTGYRGSWGMQAFR